jgi:hypothetical protein
MSRWRLWIAPVLLSLLFASAADARKHWGLSRAQAPVPETVMVKTMGWHRGSDSAIYVWRGGKNKLGTLTHELLHRATNSVPRTARAELARMTNDPKFNEGLTSYFTARALQLAGNQPTFADPAPGAAMSQLRAWSREIRAEAKESVGALGIRDIDMHKIAICSDTVFGRCHLRDFGEPWVAHPGQPGSYGNSRSRVQQIVDLVGETPVRRAYFDGDAAGLRRALSDAQRRAPSTFPTWISL